MSEIEQDVEMAINALSRKLDVEAEEIKKGIERIISETNCTQREALARWKSRNRRLFSSRNTEFLVFAKNGPKTINVKRRDSDTPVETTISTIGILVNAGGALTPYQLSLWDEDASSVTAFDIGERYVARLTLQKKGYASLVGDEVAKAEDPKLPTLDEAMKKITPKELDFINEDIGTTSFYHGTVSRIVDGGIEIDNYTSFPVMCWLGDKVEDVDEIEIGDRVIVYGRVAESRRGDYVIYAMSAYKMTE